MHSCCIKIISLDHITETISMKYHLSTLFWLLQCHISSFLPPASAVEVIKTVPSVCVCVCLSVCLFVSALTAEPFDIGSRNLAQGLTVMISWTSSMVKVKGQGHQVKKRDFLDFVIWVSRCQTQAYGVTKDSIIYGVTSWHHMTSLHDVTWRHRMMTQPTGRGRCSNTSVFLWINLIRHTSKSSTTDGQVLFIYHSLC